jgi:hypothetical protein
MVDTLFSFNISQFNRIFPFYLLIDKDGRIASLGRSVTKLYPAIKEGSNLEDVFHLILQTRTSYFSSVFPVSILWKR